MKQIKQIFQFSLDVFLQTLTKSGLFPLILMFVSPGRGHGKTYPTAKSILQNFILGTKKTFYKINPIFEFGKSQFILITRTQGSSKGTALGVLGAAFSDYYDSKGIPFNIEEKSIENGSYCEIYLITGEDNEENETVADKKLIGYTIALNAPDSIKRHSSLFTWCDLIVFDEFLPMDKRKFLSNEIDKLKNIMESVARGRGVARRFIPIVFLGNTIYFDNPYYDWLELKSKIQPDTKYYVGEHLIYKVVVNKALAEERKKDPYAKAFDSLFEQNNGDEIYLVNNSAISKPQKEWGAKFQVGLILHENKSYGVYRFNNGILYISTKDDGHSKYTYSMDSSDLTVEPFKHSIMDVRIKSYLQSGMVRYENTKCRDLFVEV